MKSIQAKKHFNKLQLGASNKRIVQYLGRWLGCSILAAASGVAVAAPGDAALDAQAFGCSSTPDNSQNRSDVVFPITSTQTSDTHTPYPLSWDSDMILDYGVGTTATSYFFVTFSLTPPTIGFTTPTTTTETSQEPSIASGTSSTIYITGGANPDNHTCTYSYTLTNANGDLSRTSAVYYTLLAPGPTNPTNPTAVPIFTPIGLIATIGGLLWFGRRRKAMKEAKS